VKPLAHEKFDLDLVCLLFATAMRPDQVYELLWSRMSAHGTLKLAVQLFKRWRDVAFNSCEETPPPSIVLTTIAGHLYRKEPHVTDALSAILGGTLDLTFRKISGLTNPANPRESTGCAFICLAVANGTLAARSRRPSSPGRSNGCSITSDGVSREPPGLSFRGFAHRRWWHLTGEWTGGGVEHDGVKSPPA
jgi:hypothetical protein